MESVRSRCDDDEDDDANSAFWLASAGFALCHRPLHHSVTERFLQIPEIRCEHDSECVFNTQSTGMQSAGSLRSRQTPLRVVL